jgi:hypothetical protein
MQGENWFPAEAQRIQVFLASVNTFARAIQS